MKRIIAALFTLAAFASPVQAAVVQITVKDAAGTTRNVSVTTNSDITGNLLWNNVICDQSAGATCASVGTAGSPSTNALTVQAVTLGNGTSANATRVTLSSDSTGVVNAIQSGAWTVTANLGTIAGISTAANQATEIASLATIATNTAAAVPAGTARIGYVSDDPCTQLTKTNVSIATSSGTVQLVVPSGITQVYVCSFSLISAATAVVNLVGGTGATCTTGTPVAALGSTTAASGASLAANGGLTFGNGGATVARTTTAGHGLCLIQSGTTALAGNITYVQQ